MRTMLKGCIGAMIGIMLMVVLAAGIWSILKSIPPHEPATSVYQSDY